ncbi:MAG TPA: hypothetical protein PLU72_05510 [Candidatus Ozemobacteraceae bacterium]|nr:hypothetical protein [Candidatus Ozemobacteraceae bacterium]
MILPLVIVLVSLMMTLGIAFMRSAVQSKNIFQVFYRDDIARLIAQSVIDEWRAGFQSRLRTNPALRAMLADPGKPDTRLPITLQELPATAALIDRLVGGNCTIDALAQLRDVDDALIENFGGRSKRSAFQGEYQATLALSVTVTLRSGAQSRSSVFVEEFDLKRLCMRSAPAERAGRGYTSTAANDYVLFVRDSLGEFDQFNGKCMNNNDRTLLITHADPGRRGKIFLGCARPSDAARAEKFVYLNIDERMKDLIPDNPPPLTIPWDEVKQSGLMPKFTAEIDKIVDEMKQAAEGKLDVHPERIKVTISVEYKPLPGKGNVLQILWTRIVELFNHFFNKNANTRDGNKDEALGLLGEQNGDIAMCDRIEGNVRQRFWQTATFKLDLTEICDNAEVREKIRQMCAEQGEIDLKYFTPEEIAQMQTMATDEKAPEVYNLVQRYQELNKTLLMSMPNGMYPLKRKPAYEERNSPGKDPSPPFEGRTGPVDFVDFLPYVSFLTRSQRFATSDSLYASPFYDERRNVLRLNGVFMIEDKDGGLVIKKGLKYEGTGVLLSYGNIVVEGEFRKNAADAGPCVLYTYDGVIRANAVEQGRIEASLIALNFRYDPASPMATRSGVDFSGRRADVLGNLVVDRINIDTMARNETNRIEYDSSALSGETRFEVTLGGRLRAMRMVYNNAAE